jgi:hypothetical protein
MHARELVELAALVSAHGPILARGGGQISDAGIRRYWIASKSRLDRWGRALKRLSGRATDAGAPMEVAQRPLVRGLLEEILTGEVLTRVWTAVTHAYDRHRGTDLVGPIARGVLTGHLEARHRVLTLLVDGPAIDAAEAVKLNRLRRRSERWTDLLIGYLAGLGDVGQFAVDPERARDFAEDLRHRGRLPGGRYAWTLVLTSLRAAFGLALGPVSPNGDLNAQIAASILGCFPPELLDGTGLLRSLWLARLSDVTDDAQGMLDDLLASEVRTSAYGRVISGRLSDRPRRQRN